MNTNIIAYFYGIKYEFKTDKELIDYVYNDEDIQAIFIEHLHNLSGPALINTPFDIPITEELRIQNYIGIKYYFIDGINYIKEEFDKHPKVIKFRNIERNLKLLNKK